jgi:hypothetical protein
MQIEVHRHHPRKVRAKRFIDRHVRPSDKRAVSAVGAPVFGGGAKLGSSKVAMKSRRE